MVTRTVIPFDSSEIAKIARENESVLATIPVPRVKDVDDPAYLAWLRNDTWWYEQRSEGVLEEMIADIPCRIFVPEVVRGLFVRIHGGGWVYGSYAAEDQYTWRLATTSKLAVISVEYRLAPENPWPAANEDCEAVTRWALENGADRFGAAPVFIGGESSGAHLALVTALRIRDAGFPLAGVNLVGGLYELSGVPSVRQFVGADPLRLSEDVIDWYVRCFVGAADADLRNPDISPLWAELDRLAPVLISTGSRDPLIDHSFFLADRIELAGGEARLDIYPDALHGFEILNPIHAERFHVRVADWVTSCLAGAGEVAGSSPGQASG